MENSLNRHAGTEELLLLGEQARQEPGHPTHLPMVFSGFCRPGTFRPNSTGTPLNFAILVVAVMLPCKEITVEELRRVDPASNNVTPRVDSDR